MKFLNEIKKSLKNSYRPFKLEGVEDARELYTIEKFEQTLKTSRFIVDDLLLFSKKGSFDPAHLIPSYRYYHLNTYERRVCNERLFEYYKAGKTGIKIRSLTDFSPEIRQIQADVVTHLGVRASANAYYSFEQQEIPLLRSHRDSYDIILLQIHGSKRFDFSSVCSKADADPTDSITLNPGDMVFLPKNVRHSAMPIDGPSLHIALGIQPLTLVDYIHYLRNQNLFCKESLAEPLPVFSKDDLDGDDFDALIDKTMETMKLNMKNRGNMKKFLGYAYKELK